MREEKLWMDGWVLTVLYSPSTVSSDSVDLAVTFSLPGAPASSSSICQTEEGVQPSLHVLNTLHSHSCPVPSPSHLHGDVFAEERHSMLLHVAPSTVGHVLVEAPQQDGAHHDGDIEPQAGQEPPTLQGHVRGPDHQGLPRAVGQREEVVAGG